MRKMDMKIVSTTLRINWRFTLRRSRSRDIPRVVSQAKAMPMTAPAYIKGMMPRMRRRPSRSDGDSLLPITYSYSV